MNVNIPSPQSHRTVPDRLLPLIFFIFFLSSFLVAETAAVKAAVFAFYGSNTGGSLSATGNPFGHKPRLTFFQKICKQACFFGSI